MPRIVLFFGFLFYFSCAMAEGGLFMESSFEAMAKKKVNGQAEESIMKKREKPKKLNWSKGVKKNPMAAGIMSAILPGLGQIYNGQWYKAPVIYVGAGVLYYFIDQNLKEKKVYQNEINARFQKDSGAMNPSLASYNEQSLYNVRNYYQDNFELCIVIASVVYLLNILDAVVYAHLFTYDVSPRLSMKIEPYAEPSLNWGNLQKSSVDAGLSLKMRIK